MPGTARETGSTGISHVTLRGGLCPDLNYKYGSYADYLFDTGDGSLYRNTSRKNIRKNDTENRPLYHF